jgi:hypothetical protein
MSIGRIAVIDDGVCNEEIPDLAFEIEILGDNSVCTPPHIKSSKVSHGTLCAKIIKFYDPYAQIGSIKVIDVKSQRGSALRLAYAIKWCTENEVSIANISLGTTCCSDYKILKEATIFAANAGLIMVAAIQNGGVRSFPASFSEVIGVQYTKNLRIDDFAYCNDFVTRTDYYACINRSLFRSKYGSNSYAAPFITALANKIARRRKNCDADIIRCELNKVARIAIRYQAYYDIPEASIADVDIPVVAIIAHSNLAVDIAIKLNEVFISDGYDTILAIQSEMLFGDDIISVPPSAIINDGTLSRIRERCEADILFIAIMDNLFCRNNQFNCDIILEDIKSNIELDSIKCELRLFFDANRRNEAERNFNMIMDAMA